MGSPVVVRPRLIGESCPMDQRQEKVQVGAGLQESRLNTEFIAFLEKYGTRALYVVLVVVLAYVGWQRWQRWQDAKLDQAFVALNAAMNSRNPDNLIRVATEHRGQGSVWIVAYLNASDHLLEAVRRGLAPGANAITPADTDRLTESQQQEMLTKAGGMLKEVLEATKGSAKTVLFAQAARWNLATVAINGNDEATAKRLLEEYIAQAEKAGLKAQVVVAKERLASLHAYLSPKALYAEAELPEFARPARPTLGASTTASPWSVEGGTGQEVNLTSEQLQELLKTGTAIPLNDAAREQGQPVLPPSSGDEPVDEDEVPVPPPPSSGGDGG